MLALRPFKKIELHDRLTKGLFQISTIRLETSSLFLWHFSNYQHDFWWNFQRVCAVLAVWPLYWNKSLNCETTATTWTGICGTKWTRIGLFTRKPKNRYLKGFQISPLLIQYNQFFCEGANRKIWLRLAAAMVAREADNRPPAPIPDLRPWSRPLIMWTGGRNVRATTKTRTVFLTRGRG